MPLAKAQPAPLDPADWIGVKDAAALTEITERHWRRRCKLDFVRRGLAELRPPTAGGKPTWWIHRVVDARLARCIDRGTRDDRDRAALVTKHPEHLVERAYRKSFWLQAWKRASLSADRGVTEKTVAARIVAQARTQEGPDFRVSVRSLYIWRSLYDGGDGTPPSPRGDTGGCLRGLEALIDRYSTIDNRQSTIDTPPRSPAAIAYFYDLFHAPAKHSAKTCHAVTFTTAEKEGWSWPASYSATARWLRETDDKAATCLHRDGRTKYSRKYMSHLELDYGGIEPGQRYVLDHTPADFWVRHRGELIRPWFTAVLDARSRCITGWQLGVSPNQDAILAALRRAFTDWAIPEHVHIDRGRDFTSELLTGATKAEKIRLRKEHGPDWRDVFRHQLDVHWLGIFGELGIQVAEATPHHPWAKGQVERVFRRFEDECGKTFFTYWGNKPETRPDCAEELRQAVDAPSFEDAESRFTDWLTIYHASPHRGQAMDGRSPIEVWRTATSIRKAEGGELTALMQSRGVYRVGPNGVTFRACGDNQTYGGDHPEIMRRKGRDVFITVDPADWSQCHAYDIGEGGAKTYIGCLQRNKRIPVDTSTDELRESIRATRRREKVFHRAKAELPKRQRNAAAEIAAMRAEQAKRLRATGTDDRTAGDGPDAVGPDVVLVRTGILLPPSQGGIKGGSSPVRTALVGSAVRTSDPNRDRQGAAIPLDVLFEGDEDLGEIDGLRVLTADDLYGTEDEAGSIDNRQSTIANPITPEDLYD